MQSLLRRDAISVETAFPILCREGSLFAVDLMFQCQEESVRDGIRSALVNGHIELHRLMMAVFFYCRLFNLGQVSYRLNIITWDDLAVQQSTIITNLIVLAINAGALSCDQGEDPLTAVLPHIAMPE